MMKATSTKRRFLSAGRAALALSLLLVGCITPFRPPADVAHLRLTTQDSADVAVIEVWLERPANSPLVVTGNVLRKLGGFGAH